MENRPSDFIKTGPSVPVTELAIWLDDWLAATEDSDRSARYLGECQDLRDKLLWFLRAKGHERCGTPELRLYLAHVRKGHEEPQGRWGNPKNAKNLSPVKASTIRAHRRNLNVFFSWLVRQEGIPANPVKKIDPPRVLDEQIQPFTPEQVKALEWAARRSRNPRRNLALYLFMLDTGARACEVCALALKDLDFDGRRCWVEGKGRKRRLLPFEKTTARALAAYHASIERDPQGMGQFFVADQGSLEGCALTTSGLRQLYERLGQVAQVEGVRCSPHTMRHTMAINYLRAGGDIFTLQELLGHTTLTMVRRYAAIAEADVQAKHRMCSPVEFLRRQRK